MKIIDSHFHVWDLSVLKLSWLESIPKIRKNYFIDDYINEYKNSSFTLEKAVYVEVDCDADYKDKENDYILSLNNDKIKSVILSAKMQENMSLPKNINLKGIREVLHTQNSRKGRCLEKDFKAGLEKLGKNNLIFEACVLEEDLSDIYESVKEFPNTKIVLNHLGNPNLEDNYCKSINFQRYKKNISALAKLSNVYCKISGLDISKAPKKDIFYILNFCINEFGENRIMYGSNFPVCNIYTNITNWLNFLFECVSDCSLNLQKNLFYKNANRLYTLGE